MTEAPLYPPVEPYATHRIAVGDGHELYVEEVGRPDGVPVVFLHGGPGGGLVPAARRFFDPDRYRVVLFDQRGAGRSTPFGELRANTTWHLVDDLEAIRARLGIDSWLVFGGSWGVTLGLAYAQTHPDRVTGLILRGVLLMRRSERDWFYQGGLRHLQPEEWDRFVAPIPPAERDDVLAAYHRRLHGPDGAEARVCAAAWGRWEAVNSSLRPDPALLAHFTDERQALPIARILSHYALHGGFLTGDTQLLDGVDRIRHLPAVIIQGRYDLCCPPASAYDLARAWPEAELRMVPDAGHSAAEPGIARELLRATDHFAHLLTG
ncbi:prolyl aminopeptidase Serine peptidase. MEROPS family S33 [Micromonospora viridifaciens]|uniref:Proline iminopeptidase n=1 Tax=Micromonospora viridifaciens TaxID=1881 RepID=A0A1C4Z7S1_MICVI|nr:prolyl aminopeptidase [Micromonospora viridifaciens]SCF28934.1 prolyl aminopeptidase Serine peptidase. MEROPS family S33 [Micromonospora viridifaciens]